MRRADDSQEFTRQVTTEEGQAFADRMGTLFMGEMFLFPMN